jgi:acyl-homoserine lactone acylase PvdQ
VALAFEAQLVATDVLTTAEGVYILDGSAHPFETEQQTIQVPQLDGSHPEEILVVGRSVHGPVVEEGADGPSRHASPD